LQISDFRLKEKIITQHIYLVSLSFEEGEGQGEEKKKNIYNENSNNKLRKFVYKIPIN
jgi:hypothetical protein